MENLNFGVLIILVLFVGIIILLIRHLFYGKATKFELSESLTTKASKIEVFKVLKKQLFKISNSVYEKENTLAVTYVRAIFGFLRSDTTVLNIKEKEDGILIIAEVDYKPSGLFWFFFFVGFLGLALLWIIPTIVFFIQKRTVKNIINDSLIKVKNEINTFNIVKGKDSSTGGLEQLEKLHELKLKGILTEEEFTAKKQTILGL